MRLYLDTEFNGHGGELISLALAAEDGKHWYGVWPQFDILYTPWVYDNVAMRLRDMKPTTDGLETNEGIRASLHEYLHSRRGAIIYADWPADFEYLMRIMAGSTYEKSWIVPCTMVLLNESEPQPEIPHNALSDAIALMLWHTAQQTVDRTDASPTATSE